MYKALTLVFAACFLTASVPRAEEPFRIEDSEEVLVTGAFLKETLIYEVTLDGFTPLGTQTCGFAGTGRDDKTGAIGPMYDFTWVFDMRALGYKGRNMIVGRFVTSLNGSPLYYRIEESYSNEEYSLTSGLISYDDFQRKRFLFHDDTVEYSIDENEKKVKDDEFREISISGGADFLMDLPLIGHLSVFLFYKDYDALDGKAFRYFHPLKRRDYVYNENSRIGIEGIRDLVMSTESLSVKELSFKFEDDDSGLIKYSLEPLDWTIWINDRGIIEKADNGKGLTFELEEN